MNVLQAMPVEKRVALETVLEKRDFSYGAVRPYCQPYNEARTSQCH